MKSRGEIAWQARQILQETALKCPQYASKLGHIVIEVSGRMTASAGRASYSRNTITLSLPYFADDTNFEQALPNTVKHEAAHLIVGLAGRGQRPHGPAWRLVHRSMGGTGERCHTLALADGFTKRRERMRVAIPCSKCGQSITLGPTQHRRHMESLAMGGRGYIHRVCP